MRNRRRRIWIDRLQTRIFLRMVLYCILLLGGVVVTAGIWEHFLIVFESATGSRWNFFLLSPMFLALLLLLPIFLIDILRFTHRFAGPIYRFRQTIKAIARGEEVALVRLRKGDMLLEMQEEFNEMLLALEERGLIVIHHDGQSEKKETAQLVG